MRSFDVIVLGAGAAGLFCAIEAAKRGRRVAVLEHSAEAGKKILISGGGRCNFTNSETKAENFLSANPHFAKSALARYTPADFMALVRRHGIAFHEKKLGQLFCDRSAKEIVEMLLAECRDAQVTIRTGCRVEAVTKPQAFAVATSEGLLEAQSVVVATGGLSIPKIGASDIGYRIARSFGLKIEPTRPALVPLTLGGEDRARYCDLAGVALDAIASADGQRFAERVLITHRGLSGPAILQISSYWDGRSAVTVNLVPGIPLFDELRARKLDGDKATTKTIVSPYLPKRFLDRWFELHATPRPLPAASFEELKSLAESLAAWRVIPDGTEGYEKAEVTAGGVSTAELSSKTMEAKKAPGLYFIGEVVDVTGQLGGFNFQWAWSSGFVAGQVA